MIKEIQSCLSNAPLHMKQDATSIEMYILQSQTSCDVMHSKLYLQFDAPALGPGRSYASSDSFCLKISKDPKRKKLGAMRVITVTGSSCHRHYAYPYKYLL